MIGGQQPIGRVVRRQRRGLVDLADSPDDCGQGMRVRGGRITDLTVA
jgi:hypothetical protein